MTRPRPAKPAAMRVFACVLSVFLAAGVATAADPEMRLQIGLKSAEETLSDLEAVVGGLAGEPKVYEDLIEPNLDIFLFGVDPTRTIRFDFVFPAKGESRLNMMIPVADQKDFLQDNIQPIGINTRRRAADYYQLTGDVYEGWIRFLDEYAIIAKKPHEGDADATQQKPSEADPRLFEKPADLALLIDENSGSRKDRAAVIEALGEQRLAKLKKDKDETDAEFELRRTMAENRFKHLPRLVADAEKFLFGYQTVAESGTGRSHLLIEPAAGTPLAEMINGIGTAEFLFAGVPTAEDPVFTARLAWPMTEARKERWRATMAASRPVAVEQLDKQDPAPSEERRAAQEELSNAVYDFLEAGVDQPLLGMFAEMRPAGGKTYNTAAGLTSVDGTSLVGVLEKIPAATEGGQLEADVETIGEIKLHKLTLPGLTPEIQDFVGGTSVYVGTAPDAIYFAAGPGGVDLLRESVADLTPATTDLMFSMRAHLGPVAEALDSIMTKRDISLIRFLQERRERRLEDRKDADEARRLQVTDPSAWRQAALEALLGKTDDVLTMELKKSDNRLEGETTLGRSILAAVGELIAKFAKENLG